MTKSSNNERFARVAMTIGWLPPKRPGEDIPPFPIPEGTSWSYNNPPKEVVEWRENYHWIDPKWGSCNTTCPNFYNDLKADLSIALWARKQPFELRSKFNDVVTEIWMRRTEQEDAAIPYLDYEIGDYCDALYQILIDQGT